MLLHANFLFFFNDPATTEIYTLSLHDALPISCMLRRRRLFAPEVCPCSSDKSNRPCPIRLACASATRRRSWRRSAARSEEHTSELQSHVNLVCRLLLEKKKCFIFVI